MRKIVLKIRRFPVPLRLTLEERRGPAAVPACVGAVHAGAGQGPASPARNNIPGHITSHQTHLGPIQGPWTEKDGGDHGSSGQRAGGDVTRGLG